jgi:hypothetical protein
VKTLLAFLTLLVVGCLNSQTPTEPRAVAPTQTPTPNPCGPNGTGWSDEPPFGCIWLCPCSHTPTPTPTRT